MPEKQKRRPVTHKHPCIAAAIHVLKAAGGGPLSAKVIFDRAFDRGLLAATAYNTLRGRLSQHQAVEQVVVVKTPEGYMLSPDGVPRGVPKRACAPSRPPLPEPFNDDPLHVVPTPRPSRRRKKPRRVRDIVVDTAWLTARKAPPRVWAWVRLARWEVHWRGDKHPTARDLLTGPALPIDVVRWLIDNLPFGNEALRKRLQKASGQSERRWCIEQAEAGEPRKPSRRRRRPVDTSAEEEPSDRTRTGARR